MLMSDRPSFIIDGKVYVSAGVLFYTEDPRGRVYFMMQGTKDAARVEDFGGKSEKGDASIQDVAFRECMEELNHQGGVTKEFLTEHMQSKRSIEYRIPELKYMLYIVYVPYSFKEGLDVEVFGDYETHDNIDRSVFWITYHDLMKLPSYAIHARLKPDEFKINMSLVIAQGMTKKGSKIF